MCNWPSIISRWFGVLCNLFLPVNAEKKPFILFNSNSIKKRLYCHNIQLIHICKFTRIHVTTRDMKKSYWSLNSNINWNIKLHWPNMITALRRQTRADRADRPQTDIGLASASPTEPGREPRMKQSSLDIMAIACEIMCDNKPPPETKQNKKGLLVH